jgi:hypothetical protein
MPSDTKLPANPNPSAIACPAAAVTISGHFLARKNPHSQAHETHPNREASSFGLLKPPLFHPPRTGEHTACTASGGGAEAAASSPYIPAPVAPEVQPNSIPESVAPSVCQLSTGIQGSKTEGKLTRALSTSSSVDETTSRGTI